MVHNDNNSQIQQPIAQGPTAQPVGSEGLIPSQNNFFTKRKIAIGGIVIILLVAILLGTFLLLNRPETPVVSSNETLTGNENVLLAHVGDRDVYRSNVESVLLEQYSMSAITDELIGEFLPITIERVILDIEAEQKGISLNIENRIDYYEALKAEVVKGEITEIEAYDINWWIPPPPDYEQIPEFTQQRADTNAAVPIITNRLRNGQTPNEILADIIVQYPSLKGIIGINGGQYAATEDKSIFNAPRTHYYEEADQQKFFYQELFQMEEGEIEGFVWPDGSGGSIIQILSVQRGENISYAEWLKQKEAELVRYE